MDQHLSNFRITGDILIFNFIAQQCINKQAPIPIVFLHSLDSHESDQEVMAIWPMPKLSSLVHIYACTTENDRKTDGCSYIKFETPPQPIGLNPIFCCLLPHFPGLVCMYQPTSHYLCSQWNHTMIAAK